MKDVIIFYVIKIKIICMIYSAAPAYTINGTKKKRNPPITQPSTNSTTAFRIAVQAPSTTLSDKESKLEH